MASLLMWHVVTNDQGLILAVYGSALPHEAEAKRDELLKTGSVTLRTVKRAKRPRVCEVLR